MDTNLRLPTLKGGVGIFWKGFQMRKKFLLNRQWNTFNRQKKILRAWQTMSAVHFCSGLAKDFTQWQYRHKPRGHNTPSAPKRYWILAFHARLHMWAIKIFLNRFLQPKAAEWQIQSVCDFTQHNHLWGLPLSSQHTLRSAFVFSSNWSSAALKTLF